MSRVTSQSYGIKYKEMLATLATFTSMRYVLSLVAKYNLSILNMDIKRLLNGEMDEQISRS